MEREGPILESLVHRLTDTPDDFLAEPRIGASAGVDVGAVVADLSRMLEAAIPAEELAAFTGTRPENDRNRLAVTLLLCWLLADDWFKNAKPTGEQLFTLLHNCASELAAQTPSKKFVSDPERREELARFALARLGFRPAGESRAQAEDRLTSLSAAERARVTQAARMAEQRARTLRESLARRAAQEAADKWTRE
jgi:hypothetical protein